MTDPIEMLRKLAEAATKGPWRAGSVETDCVFGDVGNPALMAPFNGRNVARMNKHFAGFERDAALIAAMRNALPALLDLVEEADNLANVTDAHTRRHYDAVRAALAQALEVTDG